MSRCVALCIAESSGQFYLSRCLNIRHPDRETVERDSGYSHRDRLSPRNETNRNVSLAVLYLCAPFLWETTQNDPQGLTCRLTPTQSMLVHTLFHSIQSTISLTHHLLIFKYSLLYVKFYITICIRAFWFCSFAACPCIVSFYTICCYSDTSSPYN